MLEQDFEADVIRLGLPLSLKAGAACKVMSCGPTKLRELIAEGKIDGRKRGKDLVIATASILKFNATLPQAEFAPVKKAKAAAEAGA
jgi:hypothetical protein